MVLHDISNIMILTIQHIYHIIISFMLVLSLPSCTNHSKQGRMVGIVELINNQTLYSYVIFVYFNAANESLTACTGLQAWGNPLQVDIRSG